MSGVLVVASTRSQIADFIGAVVWVYTLLILAYILVSLYESFGGRIPYSRPVSAVIGFLRDVCEPFLGCSGASSRRSGRSTSARSSRSSCCRSSAGSCRPSSAGEREVAWSRAGLVLGAVLVADQLTKRLVVDGIPQGDREAVFPAVELVHVKNEGVAFGALSGRPIVVVVVAVALAGLLAWFALHARRPLAWLPTGLLLGGALGNVIDRVRDGAVTDFIKLPAWPAFNLADVAITAGVIALLIAIEHRDAPDDPA